MIAGFGAVDVDAKPNRADVWVDGKYVGEARDLDGYPSLTLPAGPLPAPRREPLTAGPPPAQTNGCQCNDCQSKHWSRRGRSGC